MTLVETHRILRYRGSLCTPFLGRLATLRLSYIIGRSQCDRNLDHGFLLIQKLDCFDIMLKNPRILCWNYQQKSGWATIIYLKCENFPLLMHCGVLRRGWVCQKNELWFSPLLLFVAIFGSHSRGGAFESWTLWARRPTLWGIHLAICESQQSPHSSQISLQGTSRKPILLPFAF